MSLIVSVTSNELNTMVRIVEEFLKEIRSNTEKLDTHQTEKKAKNKQLDEFIYTAINETIAKNNTYIFKNPNTGLDDLFDMEFSEVSVRMYKDSITAFLDQVENIESIGLSKQIEHSKRLLEAFDNSLNDKK